MFTYNQVDIFYERSETGSRPVLLLHGWGLSGKAMGTLGRFLSARDMRVIAPDLPGFGKSFVPPESADIYFYADAVEQLMRSENCVGCDVVAHSFGARIALILAALDGMSLEDYYTGLVGKVASAGDNIQTLYDTQSGVVDGIYNQILRTSSVDLNEELVDLVKYQTAYAAAAQVFNTCNNCLDTLMSLGG